MPSESNKIANNTLIQIIGRIIVLLMTLVSVKLITNYLGPAGTGFYNTVITYLSFFIVLADFGYFSVAVREISRTPDKTKEILENIFSIRFIIATLSTLIAIAIVFLTTYPAEIKYGVVIASLFPIFNLAGSVYDMLFQARLKMQRVAWAEVISKIIALTAVYLVVINNLGIYYIIATVSLAAVANFALKAYFSRAELHFGFKYNPAIIKKITLMSLPLGLVFIVNNIYFRIDSLMLFYFKGAYDVGIYSVAYKVLEVTLFAGSYLATSLKPLLSVTLLKDQDRARNAISQALTFLFFMGLLVFSLSLSFSKEIILFISNKDFLPGAPALVILSFGAVLIYLNSILGEIMIASDLRKTLLKMAIFILTFNVLLNLYLIPRYSYIGAAWANTVSEVSLFVFGLIITNKVIKLQVDFKRSGKLILLSILMIALSFALKSINVPFLLNLVLSTGFYLSVCYFFDAVPRTTIDHFISQLSKWRKSSSQ